MAETTTKLTNPEAARKRFKFKLLRGAHFDKKGEGYIPPNPNGKTPAEKAGVKGAARKFQANTKTGEFPIIETDEDLAKEFNGPHPKMKKFDPLHKVETVEVDPTKRRAGETISAYMARLNDFVVKAQTDSANIIKGVDAMNKEQLQEFADDNEIDLSGTKNVDEMKKAIKSVLK